MNKIPIYFMPGMASNSLIFNKIKLPLERFELFFLEWIIPLDQETISQYAFRVSQYIKHKNPVLIGVSFGGILVQEIANIIQVRKVIIISSVKSNQEFSRFIKIAKNLRLYNLVPLLVLLFKKFPKLFLTKKVKRRCQQYRKFMTFTDSKYLVWAIKQLLFWERVITDKKVIHIQGNKDKIFEIKYIENCILVEKGTHIMIINQYKWFNLNLSDIILKE